MGGGKDVNSENQSQYHSVKLYSTQTPQASGFTTTVHENVWHWVPTAGEIGGRLWAQVSVRPGNSRLCWRNEQTHHIRIGTGTHPRVEPAGTTAGIAEVNPRGRSCFAPPEQWGVVRRRDTRKKCVARHPRWTGQPREKKSSGRSRLSLALAGVNTLLGGFYVHQWRTARQARDSSRPDKNPSVTVVWSVEKFCQTARM